MRTNNDIQMPGETPETETSTEDIGNPHGTSIQKGARFIYILTLFVLIRMLVYFARHLIHDDTSPYQPSLIGVNWHTEMFSFNTTCAAVKANEAPSNFMEAIGCDAPWAVGLCMNVLEMACNLGNESQPNNTWPTIDNTTYMLTKNPCAYFSISPQGAPINAGNLSNALQALVNFTNTNSTPILDCRDTIFVDALDLDLFSTISAALVILTIVWLAAHKPIINRLEQFCACLCGVPFKEKAPPNLKQKAVVERRKLPATPLTTESWIAKLKKKMTADEEQKAPQPNTGQKKKNQNDDNDETAVPLLPIGKQNANAKNNSSESTPLQPSGHAPGYGSAGQL